MSELGDFIRQQRERSAISLRKLAERAEISNPYLSQIERGLRQPSGEILKAIARALYVPAEALYERAGLLDGTERPMVEAAIEHDRHLTADQKEQLMEVYRVFIAENQEET
jgi:transcriptional regulator with XRE-family HTH domain